MAFNIIRLQQHFVDAAFKSMTKRVLIINEITMMTKVVISPTTTLYFSVYTRVIVDSLTVIWDFQHNAVSKRLSRRLLVDINTGRWFAVALSWESGSTKTRYRDGNRTQCLQYSTLPNCLYRHKIYLFYSSIEVDFI